MKKTTWKLVFSCHMTNYDWYLIFAYSKARGQLMQPESGLVTVGDGWNCIGLC